MPTSAEGEINGFYRLGGFKEVSDRALSRCWLKLVKISFKV